MTNITTLNIPTPNEAQAEAIRAIVEAGTRQDVRKPQVLALIGYAGTGKSFTVNLARAQLTRLGVSVATVAPTNQAVKVLVQAGVEDATTCHKAMRLKPKKVRGELHFTRRPLAAGERVPFDGCRALIVDEASMLDRELVDMILADAANAGLALVLFVGDDAQLPPVKDGGAKSTSLTTVPDRVLRLEEVMRGKGKCDAPTLAQVVRDNMAKGQVTIAADLRDRIAQGDLCGVYRMDPGGDYSWAPGHDKMRPVTRILLAALKEIERRWTAAGEAGLTPAEMSAIEPYAVAYRNKTVISIINDVREYLTGSTIPFVGETMVFTNPFTEGIGKDERIVYNTGDRITVQHVSAEKVCTYTDLKYVLVSDGETVNGGGKRMIMVPVDLAEWLDIVAECWSERKKIEAVEPHARSSEQVQMLVHIKSALEELQMMTDLRGVWATTAHKSQGSTYGICIVDWGDMLPAANARGPFGSQQEAHAAKVLAEQTFNSMLYVSLTRPSGELCVVL